MPEVPAHLLKLIELTAESAAHKAAAKALDRHEARCHFFRLPVLKIGFYAGVIAAIFGAAGAQAIPLLKQLFGG